MLLQGLYFADDLHAFRSFDESVDNGVVTDACKRCQSSLHDWGAANQVEFDPAKESIHVMSLTKGDGSSFPLLGAVFDSDLSMQTLFLQLRTTCKWKIARIRCTKAFHTRRDQLHLFQAKIWSYLEYRTSVIYHCNYELLGDLDALQTNFLCSLRITREVAALQYNFLPLNTRRDIAMLGLLHRAKLGSGPSHFGKFFKRQGDTRWLQNPFCNPPYSFGPYNRVLPIVKHSALGLIPVYNSLESATLDLRSVSEFQTALTEYIKSQIRIGLRTWDVSLSPRHFGH